MISKIKTITVLSLSLLACLPIFAQHVTKPRATKGASGVRVSIERGKAVYAKTCITCHQADGGGLGNMNPPLIKTTYVLGDKTRLIKIVLNGISDELEIGDQTYHNVMPSQSYLKDQEIADVLTYVRNSFGNKASAVTATDVKKQRSKK